MQPIQHGPYSVTMIVTHVAHFDRDGNGIDVREDTVTVHDVPSEDYAIDSAAALSYGSERKVTGVRVTQTRDNRIACSCHNRTDYDVGHDDLCESVVVPDAPQDESDLDYWAPDYDVLQPAPYEVRKAWQAPLIRCKRIPAGFSVEARNHVQVVTAASLIVDPSYPWAVVAYDDAGAIYDLAECDLRTAYKLASSWARKCRW